MIYAVSLSGGLDSAVTLAISLQEAKQRSFPPIKTVAFTFRYPSNHNRLERKAAADIASFYGVDLIVLEATSVFDSAVSSLIGGTVPEGHYTADNMKSTVVPMRNPIFALMISAYCISHYPDDEAWVVMGAHAGDHAIYPDCRPQTMAALGSAISGASDNQAHLVVPFIECTKKDIVGLGDALGVPFGLTRTCYTSDGIACGKCGSCRERLEAFAHSNIKDPILYK